MTCWPCCIYLVHRPSWPPVDLSTFRSCCRKCARGRKICPGRVQLRRQSKWICKFIEKAIPAGRDPELEPIPRKFKITWPLALHKTEDSEGDEFEVQREGHLVRLVPTEKTVYAFVAAKSANVRPCRRLDFRIV